MWPPTTAELRNDLSSNNSYTPDDEQRLKPCLDAAVAFVQRVRGRDYDFAGDLGSTKADPAEAHDLILGTLRLAGRWVTRRRSPDGLIQTADQGAARVSSGDPDIDRLLRIGRHAKPVVG